MTNKMLKFVKIGQQTPPKRGTEVRKKDFNEIYDEFRIWYQENYNSNKVPIKKELKKYLEKKFGKKYVTSRKLFGFKMRDDDELI